jgi:hypothetical protein
MSKSTIAQLAALIEAQRITIETQNKALEIANRRIKHIFAVGREMEQRLAKVEVRSKAAAINYMKQNNHNSVNLPTIPEHLTGEARKRAEESLARRTALRARKEQAVQH